MRGQFEVPFNEEETMKFTAAIITILGALGAVANPATTELPPRDLRDGRRRRRPNGKRVQQNRQIPKKEEEGPGTPTTVQFLYWEFVPSPGRFRRRLDAVEGQDGQEPQDSQPEGYTAYEWYTIVKRFYPQCTLAPVNSKADLDYYQSVMMPETTTPTLLGVTKDPLKAFECKTSPSDDNCLTGWVNHDGTSVPEDAALWTRDTMPPQPDGAANDPGVASIANMSVNRATMWAQLETGFWSYALIKCVLDVNEPVERLAIAA